MRTPNAGAPATGSETERTDGSAGVRLECSAMNPRGRHPVSQFLALAVLSVALAGAFVVGAAVFAVLFAIFVIGYLVSAAIAYWRLGRVRERAIYVDHLERAGYIEGEFQVVRAIADVAPRRPGGAP
jgi:hypothetical protein